MARGRPMVAPTVWNAGPGVGTTGTTGTKLKVIKQQSDPTQSFLYNDGRW